MIRTLPRSLQSSRSESSSILIEWLVCIIYSIVSRPSIIIRGITKALSYLGLRRNYLGARKKIRLTVNMDHISLAMHVLTVVDNG